MTKQPVSPFESFLEKGHAARLDGHFRQSLRYYRKALLHSENPLEAADARTGLGMAERGLGEYRSARTSLKKSLRTYRHTHDAEGVSFALYGLGTCGRFLGEFSEAQALLKTSLSLTDDPESRCFILMALGGLHRMKGLYPKSLSEYQQAGRLAGKIGSSYAKAYALCGTGNARRMLGLRKDARKDMNRALNLYRKIGDRVSHPYTLWSLALMDIEDTGRDTKRLLTQAAKLFRATRDRRGLVYILLGRAVGRLTRGKDPSHFTARAISESKALGLRLESAHARFLADPEHPQKSLPFYKRLGITPPASPTLLP